MFTNSLVVGDEIIGTSESNKDLKGVILSKNIDWGNNGRYKRLFLVRWETENEEWITSRAFKRARMHQDNEPEDHYHLHLEEDGSGLTLTPRNDIDAGENILAVTDAMSENETTTEDEVSVLGFDDVLPFEGIICSIESSYRHFFNLCISAFLFALYSSAIYLFWICSHYGASHLYSSYCAPIGFYGLFMSPFLTSTPHCTALRWLIFNGANSINGMWLVLGTWMVTKLFFVLRHKS